MGALAHYLENDGIPTTQISLIREHTEKIRPPRALWVPFELGRPLGAPEDVPFQRKVVVSALALLEAGEGPALKDFPEEAPDPPGQTSAEEATWACPIGFSPPETEETDLEKRVSDFSKEVAQLRPWYDLGLEKRGRTAVADFEPETAAGILSDYLLENDVDIPQANITLDVALRIAAQDLKAFYFEAAISQPGGRIPDSRAFAKWYWKQTMAGQILREIKEKCAGEDDKNLQMTGRMFLVPMGQ